MSSAHDLQIIQFILNRLNNQNKYKSIRQHVSFHSVELACSLSIYFLCHFFLSPIFTKKHSQSSHSISLNVPRNRRSLCFVVSEMLQNPKSKIHHNNHPFYQHTQAIFAFIQHPISMFPSFDTYLLVVVVVVFASYRSSEPLPQPAFRLTCIANVTLCARVRL